MRPYIARVCGFARGAAECKKNTNECNIQAHVARVCMYPISDLLHLLHLKLETPF